MVITFHAKSRFSISHPAEYHIRVVGRMDSAWSEWLQGMNITVVEAQDQLVFSDLSGQLPDQAALMGVLEQLHNCAICVISVECMSVAPRNK